MSAMPGFVHMRHLFDSPFFTCLNQRGALVLAFDEAAMDTQMKEPDHDHTRTPFGGRTIYKEDLPLRYG